MLIKYIKNNKIKKSNDFNFTKTNTFGFTIIELLVVISIIGLLSTISVVVLGSARKKGRDSKRVSDIKQIQTALNLYFDEKGIYPNSDTPITLGIGTNLVLCDGGFKETTSSGDCPLGKIYMTKIPSNPSPNGLSYSYTSPSSNTDTYSLSFALEDKVGSLSSGSNTASNFGISSISISPSFVCGDNVYYDGETYPTVLVGTQCWFRENLRTTKYPDGRPITKGPVASGAAGWNDPATAYYSCPPNTSNTAEDCAAAGGATKLGMLYQWKAAMNNSTTEGVQGICPSGFHIPKESELYTLENYLTTSGTCTTSRTGWGTPADDPLGICCYGAGTAMKTVSMATFSGLLAGYRNTSGTFSSRGSSTGFWSSLESSTSAWNRYLYSGYSVVSRSTVSKAYGFSVRCLKD